MIRFYKFLLTFWIFAGFTAGCSSFQKSTEVKGLAIVQGLTNATATQLAIVAPQDLALEFFYGEGATFSKIPSKTISSNTPQSTVVHHIQIENLKVGTVYTLEAREMQSTGVHEMSPSGGRVVDRRYFQSLDTSVRPARVIAASCLYDLFLAESKLMWKEVIAARPDLLLLIGDNVYAEIANGRFKSPLDEFALWTRYTETFQALDFYKTPKLIPTLVTWDDHDYGMKDGNRENPHKDASKRVLETFFAQSPSPRFPEFTTGPGVSSRFDAFGYRFLLLDDRSFRTPKDTPPEEETHFGELQEAWIFQQVFESKTPIWLISGDQWFGNYHKFESYEGRHPQSFKSFMEKLRKSKYPAFFMSGDRHMSEVNRIESSLLGYETFEFTSSSLHSKMHHSNWNTIPNPRQVYGVDLNHAFTLFDLTPMRTDGSVHLVGATRGKESKVHYAFDFEVKPTALKKSRKRVSK